MEAENTNEDSKITREVEDITVKANKEIDGRWGWVVCFSGFMCNVISFGIFMSFGIFLEPLMEHYQSSHR